MNGQPLVKFTDAEVDRMNVIEGLQYVVVGKFAYEWPELLEIRRIVPSQYGIKGECNITSLEIDIFLFDSHLWQDFIDFMSKGTYYAKDKAGYKYQLRPLIYDVTLKTGENTLMAMAWILFLGLLPTYIVK